MRSLRLVYGQWSRRVRSTTACDFKNDLYLLRVDAILLGRLGLKSSEAIEAYRKLEPALSVGPAKDDKERERNSEAFEVAFLEVLSDVGFEADTPMITTDTTKAKTSVSLLNGMLC
jgi:hypothetical protein